jgi:hypothetical protein
LIRKGREAFLGISDGQRCERSIIEKGREFGSISRGRIEG